MFNPLVDRLDNLSDAEVEKKVFELTRKYWAASRNPELQQQVLTVLEMHKTEMLLRQSRQKNAIDPNSDLDNLINIS